MNPRTVMIVEDEKDLRDVYAIILKHAGYDVCESTNGQEALEKLDGCKPDLILLDIFMPTMDGEQFMRRLDKAKYPNVKVIVCSNTSDKELMETMLALGADKIVTKASLAPTDLTDLVEPYLSKP